MNFDDRRDDRPANHRREQSPARDFSERTFAFRAWQSDTLKFGNISESADSLQLGSDAE